MRKSRALEEARRRWGPEAFAFSSFAGRYAPSFRYHVGTGRPFSVSAVVKGSGSSYEEAFKDADQRAALAAAGPER